MMQAENGTAMHVSVLEFTGQSQEQVLLTKLSITPASKIRIFLTVFAAAVMVITACFWLLWYSQELAKRDSTMADVARHVDVASQVLNDELGDLRFEFQVLSENPLVRGYARRPTPLALADLQQYLVRYMKNRPIADQLRLLSNTGQELLRVNQHGGKPMIVANSELQNKSQRDYFISAKKLAPGQVLLSRFDLNREHGQLERPLKPTFRLAATISARKGHFGVFLVLNITGQHLLNHFRQSFGAENARFSLYNPQGFLLQQVDHVHRKSGLAGLKAWGFAFGEKSSFTSKYPALWKRVISTPKSQLATAEGSYVISTVYPWKIASASAGAWSSNHAADQLFWKIVAFIPAIKVTGFFSPHALGEYLGYYLALLLMVSLLCWLFADARTRYLEGLRLIKEMAMHDALTGLPNRVLLYDRWQQAVAESRRNGKKIALLFIDLDEFKAVNDRYSHAAGDELLRQVSTRLQSCVRESDTVARIGGDEFVALLGSIQQFSDASRVAGNMVQVIARPYTMKSQLVSIQSSVGIAIYPDHGEHFGTVMHEADVAMYEAKEKGKNQYALGHVDKSAAVAQTAV